MKTKTVKITFVDSRHPVTVKVKTLDEIPFDINEIDKIYFL